MSVVMSKYFTETCPYEKAFNSIAVPHRPTRARSQKLLLWKPYR